jgi:hypothetical protein
MDSDYISPRVTGDEFREQDAYTNLICFYPQVISDTQMLGQSWIPAENVEKSYDKE